MFYTGKPSVVQWCFRCFFMISGLTVAHTCAAAAPQQNSVINVSYDLRGIPSAIWIWNAVRGGDGSAAQDLNTLTCLSATDTTYGACAVSPSAAVSPAVATIPLRFCSATGSSVCKDLNLSAWRYYSGGQVVPWIAASTTIGYPRFFYQISQAALNSLTPGTWTATLKQNLYQWGPTEILNTWTANITLKVTNTGAQTIYFPAFPGGNPRINLNLNNRPGTVNNTTASGTATLDMCLYDGGLSANNIALTFKDEGKTATGRTSGYFSVYRDGGSAGSTSDRLDYKVMVLNPLTGSTYTVTNGTEIDWAGTAASSFRRRQVALPGVSGVSSCVPVPITLVTPSFTLSSKTSGHYTGTLSVIYAPTTTTP